MKTKKTRFWGLVLSVSLASVAPLRGAQEESKDDDRRLMDMAEEERENFARSRKKTGRWWQNRIDVQKYIASQVRPYWHDLDVELREALVLPSFQQAKDMIDNDISSDKTGWANFDKDQKLETVVEYVKHFGLRNGTFEHVYVYARLIDLLLDKGADPTNCYEELGITPFQVVVEAACRAQEPRAFGGCKVRQEACAQMYSLLANKMIKNVNPENLELRVDTNPEEFWQKVRVLEQNGDAQEAAVRHKKFCSDLFSRLAPDPLPDSLADIVVLYAAASQNEECEQLCREDAARPEQEVIVGQQAALQQWFIEQRMLLGAQDDNQGDGQDDGGDSEQPRKPLCESCVIQ